MIDSKESICDGRWHHLSAVMAKDEATLFVNGKPVGSGPIGRKKRPIEVNPGLGIGRLVEGKLGCDGLVDQVRISQGERQYKGKLPGRLTVDDKTLLFCDFEKIDLPDIKGKAHFLAKGKLPRRL